MNLSKIIKLTKVRRMLIHGLSLFALILFYLPARANSAVRVTFTEGKRNAVFNGSAKMGEKDIYVVKLKKGQNCQIDVSWLGEDLADEGQGLSGYTIVFPNGKTSVDPQDGFLQPPIAGDYKIIVSPRSRKTNYRYRITFTRF